MRTHLSNSRKKCARTEKAHTHAREEAFELFVHKFTYTHTRTNAHASMCALASRKQLDVGPTTARKCARFIIIYLFLYLFEYRINNAAVGRAERAKVRDARARTDRLLGYRRCNNWNIKYANRLDAYFGAWWCVSVCVRVCDDGLRKSSGHPDIPLYK